MPSIISYIRHRTKTGETVKLTADLVVAAALPCFKPTHWRLLDMSKKPVRVAVTGAAGQIGWDSGQRGAGPPVRDLDGE